MSVAGGDIRTLFVKKNGTIKFKGVTELTLEEQRLLGGWRKLADGTVEVKFESHQGALVLLMKHYGLLTEHMRLEVSSELTLEEQEKIAAFSNEELRAWNTANDVIYFLLHPEERPAELEVKPVLALTT